MIIYAVFKVRMWKIALHSGDEGIRTPDPLLARQVLSQLSYTPIGVLLYSFFSKHGLKWTRTNDLTIIRREL